MDECMKCHSKKIVAIEYGYGHPERYDGISEYKCLSCGYREGRWSGLELHDGEIEPRYGEIKGKPATKPLKWHSRKQREESE